MACVVGEARAVHWLRLAGVERERGVYADLKSRVRTDAQPKLVHQVDLDVMRTWGDDGDGSRAARREALTSVLLAHAILDSDVGYVQGMNYMVAPALQAGVAAASPPTEEDEEVAFWWLEHCVAQLLPPGCYGTGLRGLHLEQAVLLRLLEKALPAVAARLEALGAALPLLTSGWFLTLYQTQLPPAVALDAFDAFAARALQPLQLALALFTAAAGPIAAANELGAVLLALNAACAEPSILKTAAGVRLPPEAEVEGVRAAAAAQLALEAQALQVRRELQVVQRETHFDYKAVERLQAQFRVAAAASPRGSGDEEFAIDLSQFKKIVKTTLGLEGAFAEALFAAADASGDGLLQFQELASALSVMCRGSREERVALCFRAWDADGSGGIDRQELAALINAMEGVVHGEAVANVRETFSSGPSSLHSPNVGSLVENIFAVYDADANGTIELDEFERAVELMPLLRSWFDDDDQSVRPCGVTAIGEPTVWAKDASADCCHACAAKFDLVRPAPRSPARAAAVRASARRAPCASHSPSLPLSHPPTLAASAHAGAPQAPLPAVRPDLLRPMRQDARARHGLRRARPLVQRVLPRRVGAALRQAAGAPADVRARAHRRLLPARRLVALVGLPARGLVRSRRVAQLAHPGRRRHRVRRQPARAREDLRAMRRPPPHSTLGLKI